MKMSTTEVATDKYDLSSFSPPTEYPLRNTFDPSPIDAMVKNTLISKKGDMAYKRFVPDCKISPVPAGAILFFTAPTIRN